MRIMTKSWYHNTPLQYILLPFSWAYGAIIAVREQLYSWGVFKSKRLPVPVIVVGNLTVGGTGKTPVVTWLVKNLKEKGFTPGIVSRGYGGQRSREPRVVSSDSNPHLVGDEPVMLAQQTECPVVVAAKRTDAAEVLIKQFSCDVVVSDDGLQHLAMQRDVDVAVVDGVRRYGNELLLPAGPLREPLSRLNQVDAVVANGVHKTGEYPLYLKPLLPKPLLDAMTSLSEAELKQKVWHAVAGIGHPERFFRSLKNMGYQIIPHAFADHHQFTPQDLDFGADAFVIMTEKDAVKCRGFVTKNTYSLPVEPILPSNFLDAILTKFQAQIRTGV